MTWSIIARDEQTGRVGIAVTTCNFAVGAKVPYIRTAVGAVATQAMTNPMLGPRGLALLSAGATAEDCVRLLLESDPGRDHRQVHVMDRDGRFAAGTGASCVPWSGHLVEATFSVAGNMLARHAVIEATARAFAAGAGQPFARRLIAALEAGQGEGGDKRGKQSAALLIHDEEDSPALDIRVDDHAEPIAELRRLEEVARRGFVHQRRFGPTRANPTGLLDEAERRAAIERSIAEGYE